MRVAWAMFCRYAEVMGGASTIIGGGADSFVVESTPTTVVAYLASRIVGPEDEMAEPFTVTFSLRGPQLEVVGEDVVVPMHVALNPMRTPGWEQGLNLAGQHNLAVEELGAHQLDIVLDGTHAATVPFLVMGKETTA